MTLHKKITCKTALSASRLPDLDYSINPYVGCEHGCKYCYVPAITGRLEEPWGNSVYAKENIVKILRKEAQNKRKGTIGISTITDPYQPIERQLELTRQCIEILSQTRFQISIQTKSDLVIRDLDLINPESFDLGISITTLDTRISKIIEPNSPPPLTRVKSLIEASIKKIPTWIFLGPLIPSFNDKETDFKNIFSIAKETGSKIIYDRLRLKPGILNNLAPLIQIQNLEKKHLIKKLSNDSEYSHSLLLKMKKLGNQYKVDIEQAFPKSLKLYQSKLC